MQLSGQRGTTETRNRTVGFVSFNGLTVTFRVFDVYVVRVFDVYTFCVTW
jgi:hypothetical protein